MSKQTFDFSEALRRMKEGKKVARKLWEAGAYIALEKSIVVLRYEKNGNIVFADEEDAFRVKDILATDWEEVEG